MDEVELAELPFLRDVFLAMYRRDSAGFQEALGRMIAQLTVSERSWRRVVEVAAELNDASIGRILISSGLPLECTYSAVGIAARNNNLDILRVLLQAGAPVIGENPCHDLLYTLCPSVHGLTVLSADDDDFLRPSALYAALLCGWTGEGQSADLLLEAGAQLNPKNSSIAQRSRFIPIAGVLFCTWIGTISLDVPSFPCTCSCKPARRAPHCCENA